MNATLTQLAAHALSLPVDELLYLAQALWESLSESLSSEETEALSLAKQRDAELREGHVQGRTHDEVMRAARAAIK